MTLRFLSGATALLTAWTVLAAELPPIPGRRGRPNGPGCNPPATFW